jgi:hypothetical protein
MCPATKGSLSKKNDPGNNREKNLSSYLAFWWFFCRKVASLSVSLNRISGDKTNNFL